MYATDTALGVSIGFFVLLALFVLGLYRIRTRIGDSDVIQGVAIFFTTGLALLTFNQGEAQSVLSKSQTDAAIQQAVAATDQAQEAKAQTSLLQREVALLEQAQADLRGQVNYLAERTEEWRITLTPMNSEPPPARFRLIPLFDKADSTLAEGSVVDLPGAKYTSHVNGRWVLEIPDAKQIVCDGQVGSLTCDRNSLRRITIEFERYGDQVRYPFYIR